VGSRLCISFWRRHALIFFRLKGKFEGNLCLSTTVYYYYHYYYYYVSYSISALRSYNLVLSDDCLHVTYALELPSLVRIAGSSGPSLPSPHSPDH
jgi:hypothetical protein